MNQPSRAVYPRCTSGSALRSNRVGAPEIPVRCLTLWGFIIAIRVLTCGFLSGIMRWLDRLDGHGVVAAVRPDPQHVGRDAAAGRPRRCGQRDRDLGIEAAVRGVAASGEPPQPVTR